MKLKSFIVTLGSFVFTTTFLYLIGYMFTIPPLMFHYKFTDNANGFFITTGSLVPILIGLVISFFSERFYLFKHRQDLSKWFSEVMTASHLIVKNPFSLTLMKGFFSYKQRLLTLLFYPSPQTELMT